MNTAKLSLPSQFPLEDKLIVTSVDTIDFLLTQPETVIALFFFYYKTAKRQNTNQVRATDEFCMKGLHWGRKKFLNAKEVLRSFNLIEHFKYQDKWYVRINYVKNSTSTQKGIVDSSPTSTQKEIVPFGGQMLSNNKYINAYSVTNVTDDATPARGSSCPLCNKLNPLSRKYPRGHVECAEYVTTFRFVNKAKQFKFLHSMLREGLDFPDIDKLIRVVMAKQYYRENGWDFATIASEADRRATHA